MSNYIKIFDTTLRDGEQAPGFSMNLEEKIRFAIQLERLGVDVIEAGFPAASPDDFAAVELIAQTLKKAEICGLARAIESDIRTAWDAIKDAKKPRIHTFMSTSDIHLKHQFKKTREEALPICVKAVKTAKSLCKLVEFSPMDAGRSDKDFLVRVIEEVIDAGADTINIPDTVGYTTPSEFGKLIAYLIKNVKNSDKAIFSTHCHNDLGLATSNSLAGVKNGARQIECTINGAGERAGNAALEEVVMALNIRSDFYNLKTGIKTTEITKTSKLLTQITGQKVQSNKSIVGKNAFAHESGIHQDGMLKHRDTYEILTPQSVGLEKTEIILGKHSGRAALRNHLEEMGYQISEDKMPQIFKKFKHLADKKKEISDADLDVIMMKNLDKNNSQHWNLEFYKVFSSTDEIASTKITLKDNINNEIFTVEKTGTGMVDAAYQCIEEICGIHGELTDYNIDSVTNGLDAQAIVKLRLKQDNGKVITGRFGDTDIVKASILAYLDIINKL